MLLNTVLIVSREVFEAAMLISLLLSYCYLNKNSLWGIWIGSGLGVVGALLWAFNLIHLTALWDYRGQELSVAGIYFALYISLVILFVTQLRLPFPSSSASAPTRNKHSVNALISILIALALVRELGEIIVYFYSHNSDQLHWTSLLLGSVMGISIGSSLATVLYFMLIRITGRVGWNLVRYWLAWIAGITLMNSATQLCQIGVLPQSPPLWDSSALLSEQSILGHICSALFGYKAQPYFIQVLAQVVGFGLCVIPLIRSHFPKISTPDTHQNEKVS